MHITNEVDLPEELIQAQRKGKLVIFTGTGVSMGAPACLPDYKGLTEQILHRKINQEEAPLDQLLGDQQKKGTNVQRMAKEILDPSRRRYTPLHQALLELFVSPDSVRIVTTNADRLFTKAAKKVFPKGIETFYAPALPLGRDFHGLVYLHGSVEKDPSRMVFTDADFGHAYLTDGWATEFIYHVFLNYVVLFVGYSHDDTVMKYLARSLPPDRLRFAFEKSIEGRYESVDKEKHWRDLGIIPIVYPYDETRQYTALTDATEAWAKRSKMTYLDHGRRIRDIAKADPPADTDKVTADYIDNAIQDLDQCKIFVRYAHNPSWLSWVSERSWIDQLFDPSPQESERENRKILMVPETQKLLAYWLISTCLPQSSSTLFNLIQKQQKLGRTIGPILWNAAELELFRIGSLPKPSELLIWLSILFENRKSGWRIDLLGDLLKKLDFPSYTKVALFLLANLTRPQSSSGYGQKVEMPIRDDHFLQEGWISYFQPHLDELAFMLEPIITSHLWQSHTLFSTFNQGNKYWDRVSLWRYTIEESKLNEKHWDGFDFLVDAARDVIESILHTNPVIAYGVINAWAESNVPVLRRLALHGITESPLSSDSKIVWILEKDWLYLLGTKHEVFRLLATAWPKANIEIKNTLLDAIDMGPHDEHANKLNQNTKDYELYNVYVWLDRTNPNDPLLTEKLRQIQETFPLFEPRAYPDLDFGPIITEWVKPVSPFTENQLMEKAPSEIIDSLVEYPEEGFHTPDQEGFLSELTNTASHSFDSAIKLAKELIERNDWESPIWKALFKGWSEADLSSEQWTEMLWLLSGHEQLLQYTFDVADMLLKSTEKESDLTTSNLESIEALSDALFLMAESERSGISQGDWFLLALNHTCGKVAQIWLNALNSRKRLNQSNWDGLPLDYVKRFSAILDRKTLGSGIAIAILMSKLDYFAGLDMSWTRNTLLSLLNWIETNEYAECAWHGYLYGKGIPLDFEKELVSCYKSVFEKLETQPNNIREQFCDHLAILALYASTNPISKENGWLWDFVQAADVEARVDFAQFIDRRLPAISESKRIDIWNSWLKEYWHQRNNDFPTSLAEEEKRVMTRWAFTLDFAFERAVDEICCSSAPDWAPQHNDLYARLNDDGSFPKNQPKPTAQLVAHLLKSATILYDFRPFESLVKTLDENGASYKDLYEICNQLCRLGYAGALDLADSLKGAQAT